MLSKDYARERAALIDPAEAQARVGPLAGAARSRAATRRICPSSIATATWCRSFRATSRASGRESSPKAPGFRCRIAARCSRSIARIRTCSRRASGRCTRSFRRSCATADTRIAFGIMGGWNQSQAHAQFVSNVVDHGDEHPGGARSAAVHEADVRGQAT